jgi:hypothetical protein
MPREIRRYDRQVVFRRTSSVATERDDLRATDVARQRRSRWYTDLVLTRS